MSRRPEPRDTGLDVERVRERLAFIEGEVAALRALLEQEPDVDVIVNQPWTRRGIRYALQTSIEALADICYHVSAKQFRHAPVDPHDALDRLGQEGVIPPGLLPKLHGMIGLRNRLVHGYLGVDDRRVIEILKEGLGDFEAFIRAIAALLPDPKA